MLNVEPEFFANCASTFGLDGAVSSAMTFQSPTSLLNPLAISPVLSLSKYQSISASFAAALSVSNAALMIPTVLIVLHLSFDLLYSWLRVAFAEQRLDQH